MKKHHQILAATFAIALASIAHSAPPSEAPSPEKMAIAKVNADILSKINPPVRPFSRAKPIYQYRLEFKPQMLVKDETRLPFVILKSSFIVDQGANIPAELEGFIRLGDREIYLHDPKTGADVPAAEHPRFAPVKIAKPMPSTPG